MERKLPLDRGKGTNDVETAHWLPFDPLGQKEEGWREEITGEMDGGLLRGPLSVIYRTNRWRIVFTLAFLNLQQSPIRLCMST